MSNEQRLFMARPEDRVDESCDLKLRCNHLDQRRLGLNGGTEKVGSPLQDSGVEVGGAPRRLLVMGVERSGTTW